jgi:hypothetical protein
MYWATIWAIFLQTHLVTQSGISAKGSSEQQNDSIKNCLDFL